MGVNSGWVLILADGYRRFGTVISDAAMVDRVIGMDVQEAAAARDRVPRRDRGMGERPRRREIEGIGGRLWYELGH